MFWANNILTHFQAIFSCTKWKQWFILPLLKMEEKTVLLFIYRCLFANRLCDQCFSILDSNFFFKFYYMQTVCNVRCIFFFVTLFFVPILFQLNWSVRHPDSMKINWVKNHGYRSFFRTVVKMLGLLLFHVPLDVKKQFRLKKIG